MVDLQTTEHLLHFLIGNVQLSRFDEKFISSLTTQSRVTTNQVELFYKLLYKYRRQLAKHELDPDKLIYLPWQMPMVESSKQYTQGHLTIEGDKIVFKCPYNRNFITEFRANEDNPFVWDKELDSTRATMEPIHLVSCLILRQNISKTLTYAQSQ